MKDELGGKIKTSFPAIQAKAYSCLTDDSSEDKKRHKNVCQKFENYKTCLEAT